jgi:hypothetical protein
MKLNPLVNNVIWPAVAGSVLWTFLQVAVDPAALLTIGVYLAIDWVNTQEVDKIKENYWRYDMPLAASLSTFAVATQFGARWTSWPLAAAFAIAIIGHWFGAWDSTTKPSSRNARATLAGFNALGLVVLLIGTYVEEAIALWRTSLAVLLVVFLFLTFRKKVAEL